MFFFLAEDWAHKTNLTAFFCDAVPDPQVRTGEPWSALPYMPETSGDAGRVQNHFAALTSARIFGI